MFHIHRLNQSKYYLILDFCDSVAERAWQGLSQEIYFISPYLFIKDYVGGGFTYCEIGNSLLLYTLLCDT